MTLTASTTPVIISGTTNPERMVTTVCKSCRMALYMPDRKLHMASWACPSCGAVTHARAGSLNAAG